VKINFNTFLFSSAFAFGALCLTACGPDKPVNTDASEESREIEEPAKVRVIPPDFNADSAYQYVKIQANMGPRVPGSAAHKKAVAYFKTQLEKSGAKVYIQNGPATSYDGKAWTISNVIGEINPTATKRILLAAHFDSRPFCEKETDMKLKEKPCPGINDGASGVGVLLEVARVLQTKMSGIGVDIILFDLEDYGKPFGTQDDESTWCLGSQYWAKNKHKQGYVAQYGILLDMVGAAGATFPKEGFSSFFAGDVLNNVWKSAKIAGYGNYFIDGNYGEITDDHFYINKIAQIPCIDILHYDLGKGGFFEHHHKSSDDLNTIDKNTLKAVGQTLLEVIYNEN
jgi:glutaminyl-peptide cyclotransferase